MATTKRGKSPATTSKEPSDGTMIKGAAATTQMKTTRSVVETKRDQSVCPTKKPTTIATTAKDYGKSTKPMTTTKDDGKSSKPISKKAAGQSTTKSPAQSSKPSPSTNKKGTSPAATSKASPASKDKSKKVKDDDLSTWFDQMAVEQIQEHRLAHMEKDVEKKGKMLIDLFLQRFTAIGEVVKTKLEPVGKRPDAKSELTRLRAEYAKYMGHEEVPLVDMPFPPPSLSNLPPKPDAQGKMSNEEYYAYLSGPYGTAFRLGVDAAMLNIQKHQKWWETFDDCEARLKERKEQRRKSRRKWCIGFGVVGFLALIALIVLIVGLVMAFALKSSDDKKSESSKSGDGTNGGHGGNGTGGGPGGGGTGGGASKGVKPEDIFKYTCENHIGEQNQKYPHCFVASSPGSCGASATCWQMIYAIHKRSDHNSFTVESETPTSSPPTGDQKQACKTSDGKLGTCDGDGKCNPNVQDDPSIYEKAEWEDNCDEVNPCWGSDFPEIPNERDAGGECDLVGCDGAIDAHVWMQHMRCHVGSGRIASEPCQGLPMRLWFCKPCTRGVDTLKRRCDDKYRRRAELVDNGCVLKCWGSGGGTEQIVAPTGLNCNFTDPVSNQPKSGYCFKGQCFEVAQYFNSTNKIPSLDECKKKRDGVGAETTSPIPQ